MILEAIRDAIKGIAITIGVTIMLLVIVWASWLAHESVKNRAIDPSNPQTSIGIDTARGISK